MRKFSLGLVFLFISGALAFSSSSEETLPAAKRRITLGDEIFLNHFSSELQGKSLALVINHTSVLPEGKNLWEALLEKGHRIQAIFSPEHGFYGTFEAGKEVEDSRLKEIKIYSLYGETRKPSPEQISDIDVFIYDIQDVGARFYTYITTLKYILEAASEAQIPVYILDRPNPVGGDIIEGPLLQPEYESFIGAFPIPIRYGLTIGELAMMTKGERWIPNDFDLHVVRMKGWKRSFFWEDTGLRWIPTSPNMPTPETAIIYTGSGMLGALQLNEGGGTPHPFLQFGAPWLDPSSLIIKLNGGADYGIKLEKVKFTPQSIPGKIVHPTHENKSCLGIRVRIRQKEQFRSLRFILALIKALKEKHSTEIEIDPQDLKKMFGNELLVQFLVGILSYEELLAQMEAEEEAFRKKRQKYLLY